MASGIFAILDDIGALMDDVAAASKIATGKTAGILGDDLAVNAEKATGFLSSRELPVLWAITKGSLLNKAIIIPIAMLLSFFFPIAVKVILVAGGFYLAYEGVEKIIEFLFHRSIAQRLSPDCFEHHGDEFRYLPHRRLGEVEGTEPKIVGLKLMLDRRLRRARHV